jgi:hypothetical protein
MTRYRAYQAQLAGHAIGETFSRAAELLKAGRRTCIPLTDAASVAGEDALAVLKTIG